MRMSDIPRPYILLVDQYELLFNALLRVLRPTRCPVLTAFTAEKAGEPLAGCEVGVIVGEPHAPRLAAFRIEARKCHPSVVNMILTG
jgi:hypothetical protein